MYCLKTGKNANEEGKLYLPCPNRKGDYNIMKKKLLGFLVALSALALLTGCSDDTSNDISKLDVDKYLLKVGDYKNITIEVANQVVTDEDVDMTIQYMLASAPEKKPVTGRALQRGDVSNINFVGKKDGVAFQGGTGENQELEIGSGKFIPGFEDALIGMEIGETREINVTFPEEYPSEELAGQPATFTVTLNSISEKYVPELTDEYIAKLGMEGITTVDQFKSEVRSQLEEKAKSTYDSQVQTEMMNKVLESCEFSDEVPSARYDYYYNAMIAKEQQTAEGVGTTLEQLATGLYGYETMDAFYKEIENNAIKAVHLDLVTVKILELEGQKLTNKKLKEEINNMYADFGYDSPEAFKEGVDLNDFRSYVVNKKAEEIIRGYVNIVEPAKENE